MITYSDYQVAIFKEAQAPDFRSMAIDAAAGSGKSFTITNLANMLKQQGSMIFLAFNSHIKKALEAKLPSYIQAKTFHALGYSMLVKALPRGNRLNANGDKIKNRCYELVNERMPAGTKWDVIKEKINLIADVCDMARNTLTDYRSVTEVTEMCAQYGIDPGNVPMEEIVAYATEVIEWGVDFFYRTGECDFIEMIYIPYRDKMESMKFDWMLIDEGQDMNRLQMELIRMCSREQTRVVVVGDPFQSIYGFTGAMSDSFSQMQALFNAKPMSLPICYRCPKSHIEIARKIDGNRTEPAPNAIDGTVEYILQDKIPQLAKAQDLIICRLTAPLLGIAVKLIAKRVAAVVLGRNIGAQITKYIDEVMYSKPGEPEASWDDFVKRLESHTDQQKEKISKQRNPELPLEMLNDKFDCIMTCYQSPGFDISTMDAFKHSITSLFSDKASLVTLATVHRVKGLEADRVFVIVDKGGKEVMPLKWDKQLPWQFRQELNIAYVAFTRSKRELYICCSNETMIKNMKAKYSAVINMPASPSVTERKPIDRPADIVPFKKEEVADPVQSVARHKEMMQAAFDPDDGSLDEAVIDEGNDPAELFATDILQSAVKKAKKKSKPNKNFDELRMD